MATIKKQGGPALGRKEGLELLNRGSRGEVKTLPTISEFRFGSIYGNHIQYLLRESLLLFPGLVHVSKKYTDDASSSCAYS